MSSPARAFSSIMRTFSRPISAMIVTSLRASSSDTGAKRTFIDYGHKVHMKEIANLKREYRELFDEAVEVQVEIDKSTTLSDDEAFEKGAE